MVNIEFGVEISRPGRFGAFTATGVALPATWTEIRDALDKARITDDRVIYGTELLESRLEFLASRIPKNANLYELNHLAECLSRLDDTHCDCLEGLVAMESDGAIPVHRLIHMTNSLHECQINCAVKTDQALGRFCVENELIDELSALSESVLRFLDYRAVGMSRREAEHGVFTRKGYVTYDSWPKLSKDYTPGNIPMPQKPGYPIRLQVEPVNPEHDTEYDIILICLQPLRFATIKVS